MSEKTFLVEIGTEELPPKALRSLAESFAANVTAELDNAGLAHGKVEWFAAPRRLALKVANLAAAQADREVEKRGPAIAQMIRPKTGSNRISKIHSTLAPVLLRVLTASMALVRLSKNAGAASVSSGASTN